MFAMFAMPRWLAGWLAEWVVMLDVGGYAREATECKREGEHERENKRLAAG